FGPHAKEAIAAEVARTAPAKITVDDPWRKIDEKLRGLAHTVEPFGFPGVMAGAITLHHQRKLDPGKASAAEIAQRNAELTKQYELLDEITGEISRLATQLQGKDKAGNVANSPAHKVMWKLIHAAMLSHLPETGRAALAEARTSQRDEVFDTLEALLGN